MFLNSENLFSPGQKFYGKSYTQQEFDQKIDWIAEKIISCSVHIVGFTEIGEDPVICLNAIVGRINQLEPNHPLPFAHSESGTPSKGSTKIRNAVISRFNIKSSDSLVQFPAAFSLDLLTPGASSSVPANWQTVPYSEFNRPVFKAVIELPKHDLNFFIVHLKSKRPKTSSRDGDYECIGIARSAIMRNAEAAALRYYLDDFLPNQYSSNDKVPSMLVGDFNDTPTSVPLENIRGPFDKNPGAASNWSEPDKKRLLSCARLHLKKAAYEDKLYSYIHNETFSLIDQGFVTQHLVSKFKRMEMYNDHVIRHQMMSESTDEAQQWKSMVSDHGAFVLEFTRVL